MAETDRQADRRNRAKLSARESGTRLLWLIENICLKNYFRQIKRKLLVVAVLEVRHIVANMRIRIGTPVA